MDPQLVIRAEMKQSDELTTNTTGPAHDHGYKTTSKVAPLASEKINFSYSILFNLTTSYSSYFGGKKGISRNKTSFFLLMCQQNKNLTHQLKTPLFRIPSDPEVKPFSHIAMDLITRLPNSKGYDAILTIVDHRCSRGAICLPSTTTITRPQIAKLYLNHLYQWFGLPKWVISDRDPHFTSHFGCTLTKELGIQQNLSTAFHPQTDGLSKWKNQWVKLVLLQLELVTFRKQT